MGRKGRCMDKTLPYAFEINTRIIEIKASIAEYVKRTFNFNKPVTVEGIIKHVTNKGDNKSFLEFMDHYIKRPPRKTGA